MVNDKNEFIIDKYGRLGTLSKYWGLLFFSTQLIELSDTDFLYMKDLVTYTF